MFLGGALAAKCERGNLVDLLVILVSAKDPQQDTNRSGHMHMFSDTYEVYKPGTYISYLGIASRCGLSMNNGSHVTSSCTRDEQLGFKMMLGYSDEDKAISVLGPQSFQVKSHPILSISSFQYQSILPLLLLHVYHPPC